MRKLNLVGQRFGRLTVIADAGVNKWGNTMWLCRCDCGEETVKPANVLRRGDTRSCGCLGRENLENLKAAKYKHNDFRIEGDTVYVTIPNTGREMICDIEDWDSLKDYFWSEETNGYARSRIGYFHKQICHAEQPFVVDHINRDKLDNRKRNLRAVDSQMNALNNNAIGISWHKGAQKWAAGIMIDGKHIHLGLFKDREKALAARNDYRKQIGIYE